MTPRPYVSISDHIADLTARRDASLRHEDRAIFQAAIDALESLPERTQLRHRALMEAAENARAGQ